MPWKPGDGFLRLPPPPAEGFSLQDRELTVDVVIVGGGPGGSCAAREFARKGARVVLLEEGPPTTRFRPNQGNTMRYHMQEGGAMVAMGERAFMPIAAGRGLGGGTLINSAIAWRTPAHVLEKWSNLLQDDRFSESALAPYYSEMEELLGVCKPATDEIAGLNNQLIVRGAQALGYTGGYMDRYTPTCVGCGVCNFGCPSNGKSATFLNILPEAVSFGAQLIADTKITEILSTPGRVIGLRGQHHHPDTRQPGGKVTVYADKVILSAGGIGTPRLLHHSKLAAQLGPAVGKGLHVHPGNLVMGVCDTDIDLWRGATQAAYFHPPDLPEVLPHTFSAPPEVCLMLYGKLGADVKQGINELARLCGLVVMVSDIGEGHVGAWSDGRADIAYDFHPRDLELTKKGMYHAAKVLFAGGAKKVMSPVFGTTHYNDAESLAAALQDRQLQDFTLYAAHPMSTCRIGLDPQSSVLRPDGRSHTLEGLYILDGSIFPTSLGVNPSLTIFAMTTKMARELAR